MLCFLLSESELTALLERLGYPCDDHLISRCIDYYEPRTVHGSTLSRVVHAWTHARRDEGKSWQLFVEAVRSDIDDSQEGTTKEGIHLGAMAGTVDLVQRGYGGIETRDDVLRLNPVIPTALGSLCLSIRYRGHLVHLELMTDIVRVRVDPDEGMPITIDVYGARSTVQAGQQVEVRLDGPTNP